MSFANILKKDPITYTKPKNQTSEVLKLIKNIDTICYCDEKFKYVRLLPMRILINNIIFEIDTLSSDLKEICNPNDKPKTCSDLSKFIDKEISKTNPIIYANGIKFYKGYLDLCKTGRIPKAVKQLMNDLNLEYNTENISKISSVGNTNYSHVAAYNLLNLLSESNDKSFHVEVVCITYKSDTDFKPIKFIKLPWCSNEFSMSMNNDVIYLKTVL